MASKSENPGKRQESSESADEPRELSEHSQSSRKHAVPAPPPGSGNNQSLQVALGMQLMQESSFDNLAPEVQTRLIELTDELDRRQYDYFCRALDEQASYRRGALDDSATARKQGVWVLAGLALLILLLGGGATLFLLFQGEHQLGFTLLMAGFGLVGAFLGGTGLPGFLRSLSRGGRDDGTS